MNGIKTKMKTSKKKLSKINERIVFGFHIIFFEHSSFREQCASGRRLGAICIAVEDVRTSYTKEKICFEK